MTGNPSKGAAVKARYAVDPDNVHALIVHAFYASAEGGAAASAGLSGPPHRHAAAPRWWLLAALQLRRSHR